MNKAYREQKPLNFLHFSDLNNEKFQKNFKKFFAPQFVFLPEFLCIVTNFRMKTYAKSQVVYAAFK